jgi:superfamily II DNA or RNA helicase
MDMLGMFFKNDQNNVSDRRMYGEATKWCFRDCAEKPFWRWVTHWARAMRKPSDIGFNDGSFILPKLTVDHHLVETNKKPDGFLFNLPAVTLREQREERKRTLPERCQKMAELVNHNDQAIVWCTLNDEGTTLQKNISDSVEVSGRDSDESKEQKFLDFAEGNIRVLITKPKIGAWGLNFQNCAHVCLFPTHSYEQYYQEIRRCWRFGQKRPVKVDVVFTEGERKVLQNMVRKQKQADNMFSNLVKEMNNSNLIDNEYNFSQKASVPQWL